jgi:hypothetical protein
MVKDGKMMKIDIDTIEKRYGYCIKKASSPDELLAHFGSKPFSVILFAGSKIFVKTSYKRMFLASWSKTQDFSALCFSVSKTFDPCNLHSFSGITVRLPCQIYEADVRSDKNGFVVVDDADVMAIQEV